MNKTTNNKIKKKTHAIFQWSLVLEKKTMRQLNKIQNKFDIIN